MYRGDVVGCQLFSEPGAGSDLASLQSRAVRDGDEWRITGQKVWTSGAQYSDIGEIIVRTDADQPKHKGLTGFVVDMHAPGVEVRPLRQMTGGASFNEVFFTDVRVPDDHRLGDVNQGWTVALTTLMNERAAIGAGGAGGSSMVSTSRLVELLRHYGSASDPVLRQELMELHVKLTVARLTNQRALDKIKAGQAPGPELTTAKLALTQNMTAAADFVAHVLGPHSPPTPASGARSPGTSSCSVRRACASPAAATRCCGTSSRSGSSASPRSRASTRRRRSAT
jgi:alkylation response protein AidB-like acyl-CoA dehydrogenase